MDTVNTKYVARGTTAESTDGRSGSGKDVLIPDDADPSVPDVTKRAVDVPGPSSFSTIDESETLPLPNTSQIEPIQPLPSSPFEAKTHSCRTKIPDQPLRRSERTRQKKEGECGDYI